jgi:hypothetical protein
MIYYLLVWLIGLLVGGGIGIYLGLRIADNLAIQAFRGRW